MASTNAPTPSEQPSNPGAVLIGFCVVATGLFLIFANSTGFDWLPPLLPEAISSYAHQVDNIFWVIMWLTGFFFVLTEGLLIYFVLKYRAKEGGKSKHTHGNHKLELIWTFIPGVILFALAVFQTGAWGDIKFKDGFPDPESKDTYRVQVFGKQFEWNFRYPGPDGEFGTKDDLTMLEELHVPVDKDVIVYLRTMDVLHSFFLPNVRLKQDLLPAHTIPQWFRITKTGEWEIMCAELCGSGHTKMSATLFVHDAESLAAWQRERAEFMGDQGHQPDKKMLEPVWYFWNRRFKREHASAE